jgi:hypothetical protein
MPGPVRSTRQGVLLTRRIVAITAGLVAAGAIVGSLCGAAAGAVVMVADSGLRALLSANALTFLSYPALFGAASGAVGLPVAAWGLLRNVPLGRALLITAIGTVGGAVVGQVLEPFNPYSRNIPGVIAGGFVGFLFAAAALRFREYLRSRSKRVAGG